MFAIGNNFHYIRHPGEGRDPFKWLLELKGLAWTDPRLRGDDELNPYAGG